MTTYRITIEQVDEHQYAALAMHWVRNWRLDAQGQVVLTVAYALVSGNTEVAKNALTVVVTSPYRLTEERIRRFLGDYWKYHPLAIERVKA